MKKILLAALLISPAFAQEEIAQPPGMQQLMAEMVQGKYRMKEASASPWEEEIVVTSAHIDAYVENQICESKVADVKFVNNGTTQIAEWRDPNSYEDVMYVGFFKIEETETDKTMMSIQTKTSGKILHKTTLGFRGEPTNNFWIGSGMVIKGMSGGPVIASDGKIIGILVGAVSPKVPRFQDYFDKFGPLTVIVPYSKIDEVWQKCGVKHDSN
jgi:hypothetical protein